MPHPRFLRLDADRRLRLLDAAAREFAAHGYDAASLNRVIAAEKLSKGQFYYYFDDKADLFLTALEWVWRQFIGGNDEWVRTDGADPSNARAATADLPIADPIARFDIASLTADSFWPVTQRYGAEARRRIRRLPWLLEFSKLIMTPPADPVIRAVVAEKIESVRAIQREFIRRGQALGCIRTDLPEELLMALTLANKMAFDRWYVEHYESFTEEQAAAMYDVTRSLLEPPAASPGARRTPRAKAR